MDLFDLTLCYVERKQTETNNCYRTSSIYSNLKRFFDLLLCVNTMASISSIIYSSINYSGSNYIENLNNSYPFLFSFFVTSMSVVVGFKFGSILADME